MTPILILGFYVSFASILPQRPITLISSREAKKWIIASLILAGTVASAVHIYTVIGALRTHDVDASLAGLLAPAWRFTDLGTILKITEGSSGEYAALLETLHPFPNGIGSLCVRREWCLSTCSFLIGMDSRLTSRHRHTRSRNWSILWHLQPFSDPEVQVHLRLQSEKLGSDATSTPSSCFLPDT